MKRVLRRGLLLLLALILITTFASTVLAASSNSTADNPVAEAHRSEVGEVHERAHDAVISGGVSTMGISIGPPMWGKEEWDE